MADPVPQAEPQISRLEALHFGGEATGTLSPEMQAARNKGAELRRVRKDKGGNAKSTFEAFVAKKPGEINFTEQDRRDLGLRFGAGETKRNASGNIEPPTTPEAKALYDEAQAENKNNNNIIQYSEIVAEAKRSGKSVTVVLGERTAKRIDGPKTQAEFDALKEKVLDAIINTDVIQQGLPELAAIAPADRRKLIEETLAADPALRGKVLEKMNDFVRRAKELPEPPINKEAETNKDLAEGEIRKNLDLIRNKIKELGINDANAESLKGDVKSLIGGGSSIDEVLLFLHSDLKASLIAKENLNAIMLYAKACRLESEGETLSQDDQRIITDFKGKLGTSPELAAEYEIYNKIEKVLGNEKTSSPEGERYSSPVANEIDQIIRSQKIILEANRIIENGQNAWKTDRSEQESNLISEMKNALSVSVAEVLVGRCDEMDALERQRMAKVAEEEAKKGNEAISSGIKKVDEVKATRWIEHNEATRKRVVHVSELISDMRRMSYGGEEDGNMRLIFRASDLHLKDINGNAVTSADWEKIDFSTLSEESLKVWNGVYNNQKDSFKEKLFRDFFLGKNFWDRAIFGKPIGELALKKHEYELLQRNFPKAFEKSINSKAEARAGLEKLKGIKMNGGLLAILGLLLFAPAMAAKKALTG